MPEPLHFTDKALKALVLPEGKSQLVVWDTKQRGLGYVLGATGGTFVANYYRGKVRTREALGRYGEISLPEARKLAQAVVGRVVEGKATPGDIRRVSKSGPTLAEACAGYLEFMRNGGCRPTAIETVRREIADSERSYLRTWLSRPLRSITARECRERHAEIATENGKHIANRIMRQLRSLWNHTAKEAIVDDVTFPANPTIAVRWIAGDQEGFVERRREPVPWADMPAWRVAVDALQNHVRRDYYLICILTGLRRTDACTLRWEHVNLSDQPVTSRVWHSGKTAWEPVDLPPRSMLRPVPKGGRERAFVVPLSGEIVGILTARRAQNAGVRRDDGGWVFPARTIKARACWACAELGMPPTHLAHGTCHMTEPKEENIPSPHRLRDTYITACEQVGLQDGEAKVLVNHAWGRGDVTAGYRRQDLDHLRTCQQRVTTFLLEKMRPAPESTHGSQLRSVA